jgi:hypothetical protein
MFRVLLLSLVASVPTSSNYILQNYDFGNGANSGSSSNYNLRSSVGSPGGAPGSSSYALPAGIRGTSTVKTPAAPTFTNPDNSYNQLRLTLNTAGFASDVRYAIAISSDGFATTRYVQPDQTTGTAFTVANYQTYATWGGASGFSVLGLTASTTYTVKVAALQGASTGSQFGPTASAATSAPSLTFSVETSLTATPPFSATFTSLPSGTPTNATATITAQVTTNAAHGGQVLIRDSNAGLTSSTASYTIASATADLAVAGSGYGAQISATSQSSGGPMVALTPYNNGGNAVGALTTAWQPLASFAGPITAGSVTTGLQAKSNITIPAATNYTDVLTLAISLVF